MKSLLFLLFILPSIVFADDYHVFGYVSQSVVYSKNIEIGGSKDDISFGKPRIQGG